MFAKRLMSEYGFTDMGAGGMIWSEPGNDTSIRITDKVEISSDEQHEAIELPTVTTFPQVINLIAAIRK